MGIFIRKLETNNTLLVFYDMQKCVVLCGLETFMTFETCIRTRGRSQWMDLWYLGMIYATENML